MRALLFHLDDRTHPLDLHDALRLACVTTPCLLCLHASSSSLYLFEIRNVRLSPSYRNNHRPQVLIGSEASYSLDESTNTTSLPWQNIDGPNCPKIITAITEAIHSSYSKTAYHPKDGQRLVLRPSGLSTGALPPPLKWFWAT